MPSTWLSYFIQLELFNLLGHRLGSNMALSCVLCTFSLYAYLKYDKIDLKVPFVLRNPVTIDPLATQHAKCFLVQQSVCQVVKSRSIVNFPMQLSMFVNAVRLPLDVANARMEAGSFWCPPPPSLPVWNLYAVIWFHLCSCSLVILPSPVAHSVFLFLLLAQSPTYFPSINFL